MVEDVCHENKNVVPMLKERLSFRSLEREVVEPGICTACYGCVSFCTANELNVLTIKKDKPVYCDETKCLEDGICYLICPRTSDLDEAIETKFKSKGLIGSFLSIRNLRTTNKRIANVACDGGFVTSLLHFMLDAKKIDGAVLSRKATMWNNEPMIATDFEDLIRCAGSSLAQSKSIHGLGDLTTYAPILSALRDRDLVNQSRLAVVGTPCQTLTIRKMQLLHIVPSHMVRFIIGLFCFENFLMHTDGRRYLEDKIGADVDQIERINLKDDFTVRFRDGKVKHVDLDELGPIVRSECLACTDFSNVVADVSVGGIGSPDGYSTVIVRTELAQKLINQAVIQGYLEETDVKGVMAKIEKMAKRKRHRGQRVLAERRAAASR
jgi:coenzyme F420 hydrogenase subunit beta